MADPVRVPAGHHGARDVRHARTAQVRSPVADEGQVGSRPGCQSPEAPMPAMVNRSRAAQDDAGFTLIELLVVVVIIGVLVAIAVPVYLNYRKGAADKSAQSDVRGAVSTIEQYYTDNGNSYPTTTFASQTASFSLYGTTGTASGTSTSPGGWITLS